MDIFLTNEQYNQMLYESPNRDGEYCGNFYFKHEPSGFELYCEVITKEDNVTITYVEANTGAKCFYGDKEMVEKFCEYGNRKKLTDKKNNCPNCHTPMIYHFNYCPKCGQILKWEEVEEK